jgi:hypothetical protein
LTTVYSYPSLQDQVHCQTRSLEDEKPDRPLENEDHTDDNGGSSNLAESDQPPMASKAVKGEEDMDEDEVTELLSEGDSVQDGDNEDMDDDLEAAEDDIDEDDDLEAAEDDMDEDDEDRGMDDEHTRLHVEPIAVRVEQEPETRCRRFSGMRLALKR